MNKISEIELFELLKKDLTNRFFESNSASSNEISDWKGSDIVSFQEDLFEKTKSTVSEKWFYTYFKSDFKKLPRIDMLNILAQYAGYTGWAEFSAVQNKKLDAATPNTEAEPETETSESQIINKMTDNEATNSDLKKEERPKQQQNPEKKKKNLIPALLFSIIGLGVLGVGTYFAFFFQRTYEFCFVDADRNSAITEPIEIKIDRKNFNALEITTNNGCVEFASVEDTLLMTINSTYYKQDTFKIDLRLYQGKETIRLKPDDYKVMLRHYSKSSQSVKDRIKMLDQMIDDNALIYQVYDNDYFGVEVLTKKQYINLMSLPTTSLKNFTLIDAEKNKNGKIVKIKFKII